MFLARSEYDRGVNTFSPEGRLYQVEYAIEAIKLGSTALGIATKEGILLAVEKRVSSTLLEPSCIEKIFEIDRHISCAMSGLMADSRTIVDHARAEAQNHTFVYAEKMKVSSLTQSVCDLALQFGESGRGEDGQEEDGAKRVMSRPFGVALLIAGVDADDGPQLFHADPSGTFIRYSAKAIGAGSEGAQSTLETEWKEDMSLADSAKLALKILKEVMEERLNSTNVQMASVTDTEGFRIWDTSELDTIIATL